MPNLYLQQSDGTPVATFRLYHDFAARAGQEEVVVLGIIPEAASANPAPAGSYTRTDEWRDPRDEEIERLRGWIDRAERFEAHAEKAERERDEARDAASAAHHAVQEARERFRAAEPQSLTPDAITDERVERAAHCMAMQQMPTTYSLEPDGTADKFYDDAREVLHAALTEPPARPEGAEDIEAWLDGMPESIRLDDEHQRLFANHLAHMGFRVPVALAEVGPTENTEKEKR